MAEYFSSRRVHVTGSLRLHGTSDISKAVIVGGIGNSEWRMLRGMNKGPTIRHWATAMSPTILGGGMTACAMAEPSWRFQP
jgi:hypothetical protein